MTHTKDRIFEKLFFPCSLASFSVSGCSHHQRVNSLKTIKGRTLRRSLCGRHKMSPCNEKLLPLSLFDHRPGGTYNMGVCLGNAPLVLGPFCLLRVNVVPSEEDSVSYRVLIDVFQSVTAIGSLNDALPIKITSQTAF